MFHGFSWYIAMDMYGFVDLNLHFKGLPKSFLMSATTDEAHSADTRNPKGGEVPTGGRFCSLGRLHAADCS